METLTVGLAALTLKEDCFRQTRNDQPYISILTAAPGDEMPGSRRLADAIYISTNPPKKIPKTMVINLRLELNQLLVKNPTEQIFRFARLYVRNISERFTRVVFQRSDFTKIQGILRLCGLRKKIKIRKHSEVCLSHLKLIPQETSSLCSLCFQEFHFFFFFFF